MPYVFCTASRSRSAPGRPPAVQDGLLSLANEFCQVPQLEGPPEAFLSVGRLNRLRERRGSSLIGL